MATTLASLAGTKQTTQVQNANSGAVGSAGGSSIQATKSVDNSAKLWNDIGKGSANVVQEMQQASKYAGERVGTDNLVEYKSGMNQIAAYYADQPQTSSMMVAKSRNEEALYKKHMTKGHFGDNELANQAFKDTYASPAYDNLLRNQTVNNTKKVALFKDETKRDVTHEIEFLGADISAKNLATYKQRYKTAGLDPESVTSLYLAAAGTSLEKEMNTNHAVYYDKAGNINQESVNALVNEKYKLVLGTDNEKIASDLSSTRQAADTFIKKQANVAHTAYMSLATSKAHSLIHKGKPFTDDNGVNHHYVGSGEEFQREIKENFGLLNEVDNEKIMQIYREETKTAGSNSYLVTDFVTRHKREVIDLLDNNKPVKPEAVEKFVSESTWMLASNAFTPADKLRINKVLKDATIIKENNDQIGSEIQSVITGKLSIKDAKRNVEEGTTRTAQDGNTYVIKDTQYDNIYKNEISLTATNLRSSDVTTDEGKKTFQQTLYKADVLQETLDGGTPKIFDFYDKVIKDKTNISTMSGDEIRQFVQYGDYQLTANVNQFAGYQRNLAVLASHIRELDKDTEMPTAEKENAIKDFARSTLDWQMTPKNAITMWNKALDDVKTGNNYMMTTFNSRGATNLNNVLQSVYMGEYNEDDIEKFVDSYEFYDLVSGNITRDNQRVLLPKSMTKGKFDFLMDTYLKAEGIDKGDVMLEAFRSHGASGSINIGYRVMYKSANGQVKSLGDITIDAYNKKK